MDELIKQLQERRDALSAEAKGLIETAQKEERDLNEQEDGRWKEIREEILKFDARITELVEQEERDAKAAEVAKRAGLGVKVLSEPKTYGRRSRHSFFSDIYKSTRDGDVEAAQRLGRHVEEEKLEVEARFARAEEQLKAAGFEVEARDLTRVDGAGGGFVPPLYLVDEFTTLARAGRVFADRFNRRPLPPGTDSLNIPRITTGAAVAAQTADNAAVQETDIAETTLSVPVRTTAGQQDVAIQLLDQSPIAFDEIVFADLMADYAAKVDTQLINGSGASGQILGVLQVSGIEMVTYTDATPTVAEIYPKLADGVQRVGSNRFLPATAIFMHPRRWGWFLAALDSQNRPLVVPTAPNNPVNAVGTNDGGAEGPVGTLMGLPVYVDANIPTNLGAGVNEDIIIIARVEDFWLFESAMRTRILPDVLSANLTVRLQVYAYAAATAGRYPKSTSTVGGTGLVPPTF